MQARIQSIIMVFLFVFIFRPGDPLLKVAMVAMDIVFYSNQESDLRLTYGIYIIAASQSQIWLIWLIMSPCFTYWWLYICPEAVTDWTQYRQVSNISRTLVGN